MPWNAEKIRKRSLKFIIFFLLSFIIANFFLAYLIGMDQLLNYIEHPAGNIGALVSLMIFTSVFFFVYWWFREQACIVVCPYGRLQSVLLDKNTIVVAYDYKRGEPRGKIGKSTQFNEADKPESKCDNCESSSYSKQETPEPVVQQNGDCIDCFACVRVCPTGIDIRNGTQLECVNCTACIDACDAIMTSIHKPEGLIRYASENSIKEGVQLKFTNRIKAYTAILSLLTALLVFLMVSRSDLDATLMRTAGMTYTSLPDGRISNLYNLKLANKTHHNIPVFLKLENLPGEIQLINNNNPVIKKEDYITLQFFIKLQRKEVTNWETPIVIGLYDSTHKIKTITAKFIGPEVY